MPASVLFFSILCFMYLYLNFVWKVSSLPGTTAHQAIDLYNRYECGLVEQSFVRKEMANTLHYYQQQLEAVDEAVDEQTTEGARAHLITHGHQMELLYSTAIGHFEKWLEQDIAPRSKYYDLCMGDNVLLTIEPDENGLSDKEIDNIVESIVESTASDSDFDSGSEF